MRIWRWVSPTLSLLGLPGCPGVPPTTGGGTDSAATEGGNDASGSIVPTGGESATGGDQGKVADHRTYFIAETVKFDGDGECQNSKLNAVTRRLRTRLDNAGWTGLRFVDENTWPEDFWESSLQPNGVDSLYADAHRLAIYAGHGAPGFLQWGNPSDAGACITLLSERTRLGRLGGDTSAAVMLMTSCTLHTEFAWENFEPNATRQFFGYHNSPHINSGEPRRVFKRTQDGQSTKDAWLDEMEQNSALGKNSPVVLTTGVSGAEAMQIHSVTNLASGAGFIESVGEPADAFYIEWLNNGCTPACGGTCAGFVSPVVPSIQVGATVPIVHIERPRRTIAELTDRAAALMTVLQDGPLSTLQRAKVREWANSAIASGDITVVTLPGTPGVQVAYEPIVDLLVVDNLDAREAARPVPSETPHDDHQSVALTQAGRVRDEALRRLSAIQGGVLGLPNGATFAIGTREAGVIEQGGARSGLIPFEYKFSAFGEFAGYPVLDARLELGVTRQGKLSRIAVSSVVVRKVSSTAIVRTPTDALRVLERDIAARNPGMLRQEIVVARVGIAFPRGVAQTALTSPELLADYVVAYPGDGTTPVVSRRYPVALSLLSQSAPTSREDPDEDLDDLGDRRHEAPVRP